MTGPALLNNVDHRDLRIAVGYGAHLGDAVNHCRVFPTEFEALQRDYAIVLRRDARDGYAAIVLLGLDKGENVFLTGGRWDARYVPALHARGPFSIGTPPAGQDGEPVIHVDAAHPRIDPEGAPVFREQGGNAPALDHAAAALQRIYVGDRQAPTLFAAWEREGLIAPVMLRLDLDEGRRVTVPDCLSVDSERLAALDGAALDRLHRDDHLRPAVWVASSLGNIPHLLDRKLARDAGR